MSKKIIISNLFSKLFPIKLKIIGRDKLLISSNNYFERAKVKMNIKMILKKCMKSLTSRTIILVTFISPITYGAYGFPECPGTHCSQYSSEINSACIAAGLSGKPFPVVGPSGATCTCPCSCVISGTFLSLDTQSVIPIEISTKGQYVFNPYTRVFQSPIAQTTKSSVHQHKILKLTFSDHSTISVSGNHTFVRPNETIISAEQLVVGDLVLNGSGQVITVIENQEKLYSGNLHNVIINPKSAQVSDHIVVFNNILSGDLLVQEANDQIKNEIALRMKVVRPLELGKGVSK